MRTPSSVLGTDRASLEDARMLDHPEARFARAPRMTQSQDPRVTSAIAHWAPRFVANGVALTDFEEVTGLDRRAGTTGARAWSARARRARSAGARGARRRKHSSAPASTCSAPASTTTSPSSCSCTTCADEGRAHEGGRVPPARAAASPPAGRARRDPLRGQNAVRHPAQAGRRRAAAGRGDGAAASIRPRRRWTPTSSRSWRAAWRRSRSTVPARARPSTTSPSAATTRSRSPRCSTGCKTRRDVDAGRAGLWGVSLGGYYAPRAAAFEKRVKACIALAGPYDWATCWDALPELTREAFRVRSQVRHAGRRAPPRRDAVARPASRRASPARSSSSPASSTAHSVAATPSGSRARSPGPVELLIIEDGNHVANNRAYR